MSEVRKNTHKYKKNEHKFTYRLVFRLFGLRRVAKKIFRFLPKYKVHGERILTNSTFIGLHNFNPLNCGFYIEYQRNKEQYKREDIAS